MGSPEDDEFAEDDEKPQHRVKISKSFAIGVLPVTNKDYRLTTCEDYEDFEKFEKQAHAKTHISWFEVIEFCNLLSEKEGIRPYYSFEMVKDVEEIFESFHQKLLRKLMGKKKPTISSERKVVKILGGDGYRLPTEAEWEYACRAGSDKRWCFGNDPLQLDVPPAHLNEYCYYGIGMYELHPVGIKKPNQFGLHDMHGNVWEWCWDIYEDYYYHSSPTADPQGPASFDPEGLYLHEQRVIRGAIAQTDSPEENTRSARRQHGPIELKFGELGFRIARTIER